MGEKTTVDKKPGKSEKKIKTVKISRSNAYADRPKISMEGKWLEQIGFHIGDKLKVSYGNGFIFISHAVDMKRMLTVNDSSDTYMAGVKSSRGMEPTGAGQDCGDVKTRQIKVSSSIHVRQTAWKGGGFYYPERSKISMEGKWLEQAGFSIGKRIQIECREASICIYPAV